MASERYTRTNQKLYFAQQALESWRAAEASQALNAQTLIQGARETALFHLYGALLGLCHEIAGFYRMPQADAPRAEAFLNHDALEATPSPELGELVEVASERGSWLAQLLTAYQQLFLPPLEEKKAKVDPAIPLITAINVGLPVREELSLAVAETAIHALKALAVRFREGMSEW